MFRKVSWFDSFFKAWYKVLSFAKFDCRFLFRFEVFSWTGENEVFVEELVKKITVEKSRNTKNNKKRINLKSKNFLLKTNITNILIIIKY